MLGWCVERLANLLAPMCESVHADAALAEASAVLRGLSETPASRLPHLPGAEAHSVIATVSPPGATPRPAESSGPRGPEPDLGSSEFSCGSPSDAEDSGMGGTGRGVQKLHQGPGLSGGSEARARDRRQPIAAEVAEQAAGAAAGSPAVLQAPVTMPTTALAHSGTHMRRARGGVLARHGEPGVLAELAAVQGQGCQVAHGAAATAGRQQQGESVLEDQGNFHLAAAAAELLAAVRTAPGLQPTPAPAGAPGGTRDPAQQHVPLSVQPVADPVRDTEPRGCGGQLQRVESQSRGGASAAVSAGAGAQQQAAAWSAVQPEAEAACGDAVATGGCVPGGKAAVAGHRAQTADPAATKVETLFGSPQGDAPAAHGAGAGDGAQTPDQAAPTAKTLSALSGAQAPAVVEATAGDTSLAADLAAGVAGNPSGYPPARAPGAAGAVAAGLAAGATGSPTGVPGAAAAAGGAALAADLADGAALAARFAAGSRRMQREMAALRASLESLSAGGPPAGGPHRRSLPEGPAEERLRMAKACAGAFPALEPSADAAPNAEAGRAARTPGWEAAPGAQQEEPGACGLLSGSTAVPASSADDGSLAAFLSGAGAGGPSDCSCLSAKRLIVLASIDRNLSAPRCRRALSCQNVPGSAPACQTVRSASARELLTGCFACPWQTCALSTSWQPRAPAPCRPQACRARPQLRLLTLQAQQHVSKRQGHAQPTWRGAHPRQRPRRWTSPAAVKAM